VGRAASRLPVLFFMMHDAAAQNVSPAAEFGGGSPWMLNGTCTLRKAGDKMLIEGIISSETLDADGEIVVQDGLDFTYFMEKGWFNDNHKQDTSGGLGVPLSVEQVVLPNGKRATKVLGELFDIPESRKIFELAQAAGDRRPLGFSLEGAIVKRDGPGGKIVASAKVRDCSITRHPKNPDSTFQALAKALKAHEVPMSPVRRSREVVRIDHPFPDMRKALAAGYNEPAAPVAQPLVPQSMHGTVATATYSADKAIDKLARELNISKAAARRIYNTLQAQRRKG